MNLDFAPENKTQFSLSLAQRLAYALPSIATSFLLTGPLMVMQGIYSKHFGLSLRSIATILLIANLFNAITDPMVGYCSDWYYGRGGSRKSFVVGGGLLFIVSGYFLFSPPDNVSAFYFLVWLLCFFLAFTIFEIPHLAWASELSAYSREKTQLYSWKAFMVNVGSLAFYAMPQLPIFETTEFTPQTLRWSAIMAGALMLFFLVFCIRLVPNNHNESSGRSSGERLVSDGRSKEGEDYISAKERRRLLWVSIFRNKPFLLFVAAFFLEGIGVGMLFSLMFIFIDSFLGLGDKFSLLSMIGLSVSTLSLWAWYKLANYLGKILSICLGIWFACIGIFLMGFLIPGQNSYLTILAIVTLIYFGLASPGVLAPALLSDIIDYGTWKFGVSYSGTYFSVFALILKANLAIGGSLGLAISGWYGFDPSARVHADESLFGLRLAIAWMPALVIMVSLVFIALIPINARRHAIIQKRLHCREIQTKSNYLNVP